MRGVSVCVVAVALPLSFPSIYSFFPFGFFPFVTRLYFQTRSHYYHIYILYMYSLYLYIRCILFVVVGKEKDQRHTEKRTHKLECRPRPVVVRLWRQIKMQMPKGYGRLARESFKPIKSFQEKFGLSEPS